jgi:hypothetical protein
VNVGEDREKYKYPTALNGHLSAALRTPGVALPHSPKQQQDRMVELAVLVEV